MESKDFGKEWFKITLVSMLKGTCVRSIVGTSWHHQVVCRCWSCRGCYHPNICGDMILQYGQWCHLCTHLEMCDKTKDDPFWQSPGACETFDGSWGEFSLQLVHSTSQTFCMRWTCPFVSEKAPSCCGLPDGCWIPKQIPQLSVRALLPASCAQEIVPRFEPRPPQRILWALEFLQPSLTMQDSSLDPERQVSGSKPSFLVLL